LAATGEIPDVVIVLVEQIAVRPTNAQQPIVTAHATRSNLCQNLDQKNLTIGGANALATNPYAV